jgi:hypothetical protein
VEVPQELLHYDDRRRFLAVQVAHSAERAYWVPGDDADLAALARSREAVEMSPVGESYVLYGVGAQATGERFAYYDRESGLDIPLFPDYLAFEENDRALDAKVAELQQQRKRLQAERARLSRKSVSRRRVVTAQLSALDAREKGLVRVQERTAEHYEDYDKRRLLAGKLRLLQATALGMERRSYDLEDSRDRRAFRGRLLSLIRPEARELLLEIADAYHAAFSRPLPVTSLVRSRRYQEHLRRTNPNAASIDPPPHATGLAFDVFTRHMTATEQAFLLGSVAKLERDGRVEALFERNRDHVHVFVFGNGARPAESLIAQSLERIRPSVVAKAPAARIARPAPRPAALRPPLPRGPGR